MTAPTFDPFDVYRTLEDLNRNITDGLLGQVKSPQPDGALTHYTTQVGAKGIVESSTLWSTHARYLNDEKELRYVAEPLGIAWERVRAGKKHLRVNTRRALNELGMALVTGVGRQTPSRADNVYVTCFCEDPDLLSQWRGYGGSGGPAYALTFNPDDFHFLHPLPAGQSRPTEPQYGAPTVLVRVIYDREEQVQLIVDVLEQYVDACLEYIVSDQPEVRQLAHEYAGGLRNALLVTLSAPYKHPGFAEENEWRLVTRLHVPAETAPTEFRPTRSGLAPYFALGRWGAPEVADTQNSPIYPRRRLPLISITQGPTANPDRGAESMLMLANRYGYRDVEVGTSEVPYRQS